VCHPGNKYVTQQTGKLNERSRTATFRSQQQIRTESYFTATTGIRTCDLQDASAPSGQLGQVPPRVSWPIHVLHHVTDHVIKMPGAGCPDKSNEETIRMVVALADVIAPRDHEFRVVARRRDLGQREQCMHVCN
jgi:hypothetical protein